jgi:Domain of unknown function (DUF4136)
MNRFKQIATAALLGTSLALAGCAAGLPAKVTRYSALPVPQGQSFYVVPGRGIAANGGLEYQSFAGLVAQQLAARGYVPAASPQTATMIVQLGYDVDQGTEHRDVDPFVGGYGGFGGGYGGYGGFGGRGGFFDPRFGIYYGRPYYSRFGYYGSGLSSPFFYGWDDAGWYGNTREYTEYKSELTLDIRDRVTNRPLFDGRAQARSTTDELGTLVPNLVEAMFTGFPGRNGETVKITVPARRAR